MPPKKAKKKKGAKGKATAGKEEEDDIPEEFKHLSASQLRSAIESFRCRLQTASRDRNYMQLELDMVNKFSCITSEEKTQLQNALHVKDEEVETLQRNHLVELRVYQHNARHLDYSFNVNKVNTQKQTEEILLREETRHQEAIQEYEKEKRELVKTLGETNLANQSAVRQLEEGFAKNLAKLGEEFEKNLENMRREYDEERRSLKEDLELDRRVELHKLEEQKNQHINDLMRNHQEGFDQIKAYYNEITRDNLQLIQSLKDELRALQEREKTVGRNMRLLQSENTGLAAPLKEKEEAQKAMEDQLRCHTKDKLSLKNLKARSIQLDARLKEGRQEYRNLEEKYRKAEKERDDLSRRFSRGLKETRRKADHKNVLLQRKIDVVENQLNAKQAETQQLLKTNSVDPAVASEISAKLEQVLGSKNRLIKDLQFEVRRCVKAYNETITLCEEKIKELGVPIEDVSFEPISAAVGAGGGAASALPTGILDS